jgi:hypothetical protein
VACFCFTSSLTWLGYDYLTQPVEGPPTTGVNRDEKSSQRKPPAQRRRDAASSERKGPKALIKARNRHRMSIASSTRKTRAQKQKKHHNARTGPVGGAAERFAQGPVLPSECAVTGVADPVETGQRHQTVSQGDTTTPGFVPSRSIRLGADWRHAALMRGSSGFAQLLMLASGCRRQMDNAQINCARWCEARASSSA